MKIHTFSLLILSLLAASFLGVARADEPSKPRIYIPYKDIASVVDPGTKAVLMERQAFEKLLAAAQAQPESEDKDLGQITNAEYSAEVSGETLTVAGTMTVVSMSAKALRVPLPFAHLALTRLELDGRPAPLGTDEAGKTILIIEKKGPHALTLAGSALLQEFTGGGLQFTLVLPPPSRAQ